MGFECAGTRAPWWWHLDQLLFFWWLASVVSPCNMSSHIQTTPKSNHARHIHVITREYTVPVTEATTTTCHTAATTQCTQYKIRCPRHMYTYLPIDVHAFTHKCMFSVCVHDRFHDLLSLHNVHGAVLKLTALFVEQQGDNPRASDTWEETLLATKTWMKISWKSSVKKKLWEIAPVQRVASPVHARSCTKR